MHGGAHPLQAAVSVFSKLCNNTIINKKMNLSLNITFIMAILWPQLDRYLVEATPIFKIVDKIREKREILVFK